MNPPVSGRLPLWPCTDIKINLPRAPTSRVPCIPGAIWTAVWLWSRHFRPILSLRGRFVMNQGIRCALTPSESHSLCR